MKVKCIYNTGAHLPNDMLFDGSTAKKSSEYPLTIDRVYTVYAMIIHDGYTWYYLVDEYFTYFPRWRPCPLFDVVDGRISRYWIFSYEKGINYIEASAVWAYPEWANDPNYYDYLTDVYEREVKLFAAYREKMDFEFPDNSISDKAQIGDEEWLICPDCIDAWQSESDKDALVRCPKCRRILNNPRFINAWPHL